MVSLADSNVRIFELSAAPKHHRHLIFLHCSIICMMSVASKITKFNIVQAAANHTATLFFFHGSGDTGDNVKEWIRILNKEELRFPHIKVIYPTAPLQPYTPNGGQPSNVWFDRKEITKFVPEELTSVDSMCQQVSELVEKEVAEGIPYDRIVIGGFSMGGALSFHVAYRFKTALAGCFAMSSFLNEDSIVYKALKSTGGSTTPPLLQFHGSRDDLVPMKWGEETFKNLTDLGVNGEFVPLKNAYHELTRLEIGRFKEWLTNVLPETSEGR